MTSARNKTKALGAVVLCALLALQFVAVLHDSTHAAGEVADYCETCVRLDASTPLASSFQAQLLEWAPERDEFLAIADPAVAVRSFSRGARAPPSL